MGGLKALARFAEEQIAKAAAAKTPEVLCVFAREEGVELTEKELDIISGGDLRGQTQALHLASPYCGEADFEFIWTDDAGQRVFRCTNFGNSCADGKA